jgi:hypothetical protein
MANDKTEAPEKPPRKSQPEALSDDGGTPAPHPSLMKQPPTPPVPPTLAWPTHARDVRLKGSIRLPGQACDWLTTDSAKAKSGRAVVESLAVAPWGICITGGEKQFSEPVVNVPWAQVEYWVPA